MAAWQPPSLYYGPEYVRVQCRFPTSLPLIGLAMFRGKEPIGFIAAMGRSSTAGELYLSSLLSFVPGTDPILPIVLVRRENRMIEQLGKRVLLFTRTGSPGEALVRSRASSRRKCVSLGQLRLHASSGVQQASTICIREVKPDTWGIEADRLRDSELLSPALNLPDLQHFGGDPHGGRRFLLATNDSGHVLATAMLGFTQSAEHGEIRAVPSLHYVRLAEQRPEPLRGLLAYARNESSPVVLVPNTTTIESGLARAAGLRGIPTVYTAHLCTDAADAISVRGTEFEIV